MRVACPPLDRMSGAHTHTVTHTHCHALPRMHAHTHTHTVAHTHTHSLTRTHSHKRTRTHYHACMQDEDEWRAWKAVGDEVVHIELRRWVAVNTPDPAVQSMTPASPTPSHHQKAFRNYFPYLPWS